MQIQRSSHAKLDEKQERSKQINRLFKNDWGSVSKERYEVGSDRGDGKKTTQSTATMTLECWRTDVNRVNWASQADKAEGTEVNESAQ